MHTIKQIKASMAMPPDCQAFDKIEIRTVPRFKESDLSGSEWRISAVISFYYKGVIQATESFHSVEEAVKFLVPEYYKHAQNLNYDPSIMWASVCNQEGCAELPTVTYKMKNTVCSEGHITPASERGCIRRFCDKHRERGDQSIEDSTENYSILTETGS